MTHDEATLRAREIASRVLAPAAGPNDKAGRFSTEAVDSLGQSGLLALMLPPDLGGPGLGPRTFAAVAATLAEADASVAMVYLMHILGVATIRSARPSAAKGVTPLLQEVVAFPTVEGNVDARNQQQAWVRKTATELGLVVRDAGLVTEVELPAAKKDAPVLGYAKSYIVSSLAPDGAGPTDSTLYLVPADTPGVSVAGAWDGLGLRANASAPLALDNCKVPSSFQLTDDGAGFQVMLNVVLPLFNLGAACVALGLCRAAVAGTTAHLKSARFEHLGQSLGESLPTLRAQLASMQIDTDGLSARIDDLIEHLESPREATMLRVLESKAAAGDVAIGVTSTAMRICGGAAFSKHMSIERLFRDAHAGAVMAPTGDVLREFIGKALLGMPLF